MSDNATNYEAILVFWFDELTTEQWFKKSERLDAIIKERFAGALQEAAAGEYWAWRQNDKGRLAEIILLDQFSRNIYRDSARAFAQDPMALVLAQEAVAQGIDKTLSNDEKAFLYMPYMHSESARIHEKAEELFNQPGLEHNYQFEVQHKAIIDRFGRYPHRNQLLGRKSSEAEIDFLRQPGSSF